jgi:hypothetical protein
MSAKKKEAIPAKKDANHLRIVNEQGKTKERKMAETGLCAPTLNAITARNFVRPLMGENDLTEIVSVMQDKVAKVKAGDLSDMEATLTAQVVTLDVMFNELARRAGLNFGEYIKAAETYMRLALKAQAQTARTIEVLAALKNPPVVFAKQANISHGHQQVNNVNLETNTHIPAHAGETINQQNELLEGNHGSANMDTRTMQTSIPKDQAMAAVE